MLKNQFFKVKNNLWELEKDFIELNNREIKIKREIEKLFSKWIIVSIDHMDRFEKKKWRK